MARSAVEVEHRDQLVKQLGQLRAVLRDLEAHALPLNATPGDRIAHTNALVEVRQKIHDLDLEVIRLS